MRFKEEKQKKKRVAVMHDRGLRWIPVWYTGIYDNLCMCKYAWFQVQIKAVVSCEFDFVTDLTIKSNSEPASIRTPKNVEKAPSSTGANMCSSASTARL